MLFPSLAIAHPSNYLLSSNYISNLGLDKGHDTNEILNQSKHKTRDETNDVSTHVEQVNACLPIHPVHRFYSSGIRIVFHRKP